MIVTIVVARDNNKQLRGTYSYASCREGYSSKDGEDGQKEGQAMILFKLFYKHCFRCETNLINYVVC